MKEINNTLANKRITGNEFLQIYNVFINKFDEKKLLDYGNELKKLLEHLLIPQDED